MTRAPIVHGVVFAGGSSRRMGRDKARLEIDGVSLLARVASGLEPLVERVWISAGHAERYADFGLPTIVDETPDAGALAGLAKVLGTLEDAGAALALVAPCDAAELPASLLGRLVDALVAGDDLGAALAVDAGGALQPLIGCYRVAVGPRIAEAVAAGERRVVSVEQILRTERVLLREGERLVNLNTEAQLAVYLHPRGE